MHQNNSNNIYSPSMKLWEGNVLADVCLSVHSGGEGGPNVTIIHDALNLTVQSPFPPSDMQSLSSDIWWSSLETCSNLFT